MDRALRRQLKPGTIDSTSYQAYYQAFMPSVGEGFSGASLKLGTPDHKILQEIRLNVATFSAFKNHSFVSELIEAMFDKEGKLLGRKAFLEKAHKLDSAYHDRWYEVERDLVVGKSRSVVRWNKFQEQKDLYPHVIRREIIDKRTRPHHVKWNGAVLSLEDPVLDLHWAPDEPRCRGWMSQTRKPLNDRNINFADLNNELTPWNINPGKFGRVVTNDHPYFQVKNFKDIAKQAMEAVLVNQRQEVLDFWRGELKGMSETVLTADKQKVQLRLADIGKVLETPSKNEWFRNELVMDLREVFGKMEFAEVRGEGRVYQLEVYGREWEVRMRYSEVGELTLEEVVEWK